MVNRRRMMTAASWLVAGLQTAAAVALMAWAVRTPVPRTEAAGSAAAAWRIDPPAAGSAEAGQTGGDPQSGDGASTTPEADAAGTGSPRPALQELLSHGRRPWNQPLFPKPPPPPRKRPPPPPPRLNVQLLAILQGQGGAADLAGFRLPGGGTAFVGVGGAVRGTAGEARVVSITENRVVLEAAGRSWPLNLDSDFQKN